MFLLIPIGGVFSGAFQPLVFGLQYHKLRDDLLMEEILGTTKKLGSEYLGSNRPTPGCQSVTIRIMNHFLVWGSQPKPLFATMASWGFCGVKPNEYLHLFMLWGGISFFISGFRWVLVAINQQGFKMGSYVRITYRCTGGVKKSTTRV